MANLAKYTQLIATITARNSPPGPATDCNWSTDSTMIHLALRGLFYQGPCGQERLGTAGALVGGGLGTVSSITSNPAFAANPVGAAVSIGSGIVGSVLSIFTAHHVAAVRTEQSTICAVSDAANQGIPQIDAAVASGQISAAEGIDAMSQLVQQLKNALSQISGVGSPGHPCNAGCCFQHILDCHLDFAQYYYVDISPMPTLNRPGQLNYDSPANSLKMQIDNAVPPGGSPTALNTGMIGISWGWLVALAVAAFLVYKVAVK